jgi:3-hydroxybutyryl-CoA dehydrogenase
VLDREFGGTRYTPAPLLRRLTDAGRLGRKSGAGFYDYSGAASASDSAALGNTAAASTDQPPAPGTITLIDPAAAAGRTGSGAGAGQAGQHPDRSAELASLIAAAGINVTRNPAHPSDLIVVAIGGEGGVIGPATAAGRAADSIGLHLATPELAELVATPVTSARALGAARALIARLGLRAVRSADRPGLLVGALLYPHLRDAVAMVDDAYATSADVDTAMTLGCGYPRGPIELLAHAGVGTAVEVLRAMNAGSGDPAFAPSPLMTQYAQGGLSPVGHGE